MTPNDAASRRSRSAPSDLEATGGALEPGAGALDGRVARAREAVAIPVRGA